MPEPTVQEQVDAIELSMTAAKEKIALADAVMRLIKNKDFKRVFLEHFMRDDVARSVKLLADPSCHDARSQDSILKSIHAVGQVDQFLRMTVHMGNLAEKALRDDEEAREELLTNEAV